VSNTSLDSLSFSGLVWEFELPPNKHKATSIQQATPFASTFLEKSICSGQMKKVKGSAVTHV